MKWENKEPGVASGKAFFSSVLSIQSAFEQQRGHFFMLFFLPRTRHEVVHDTGNGAGGALR